MADIARTLTAERGDSADVELLAWAEAVRAAIASHARDLDTAMPWARLVFGKAPLNRATMPEQDLVSTTMARFFLSVPTLADAPDRCESAIRELTTLRERLAKDSAAQSDALAGIDAIIEGLARSAAACEALLRRLSTLIQLTKTLFEEMEFGFLFDRRVNSSRSAIAFPTTASIRVVTICWPLRRDLQASSPSQRVTCLRPIGSTSVAL